MGKDMITLCQCASCKQSSSLELWNSTTSENFGDDKIQELKKEVSPENCVYDCPECGKENMDIEIVRVDWKAHPVAVTVSYTMYVAAESAEAAVKKAEKMTVEELLSGISLNPTIEIEEREIGE